MSDASPIKFVANHEDLSTDRGFQFKFHCDKCGNGVMSRFEASAIGTAGELLRGAASLFGGVFSQVADSSYHVQRAIGGKAHDDALARAVEAAKPNFRHCTRCGKWVCPEACWNAKAGLCEDCAPDLEEELGAARAQAQRDQIFEKARSTDLVGHVDVRAPAAAVGCRKCGADLGGKKFCPQCGTPTQAARADNCGQCGAPWESGSRFCGDCGAPRG